MPSDSGDSELASSLIVNKNLSAPHANATIPAMLDSTARESPPRLRGFRKRLELERCLEARDS